MKRKVVFLYSGGIRSICGLLDILTNPSYVDYLVQIHFIHIINYNNRFKADLANVKTTLPIFKQLFKRDIIITENQVNFSCLPAQSKLPSDYDICLFMATQMLNIDISIRYMVLGFTAEQLSKKTTSGILVDKIQAFNDVTKQNKYAAQDSEYLLPLANLSDANIVNKIKSYNYSALNNCLPLLV